MSTTSIKLSNELKQRAMTAAQEQGITPHAFMVLAIEHATTIAENRASFVAEAETARNAMLKSGKGYDADEVHAHIRNRISGKALARPKAKAWRG